MATLHPTTPPSGDDSISPMARSLISSEILVIAQEIRALIANGTPVTNLTVGDFDPAYYPLPEGLRNGVLEAINRGEQQYPPPAGTPELRESVRRIYKKHLGLEYSVDSVLVSAGARPLVAATYLALAGPGRSAVFGVPSWNNNHYCHLTSTRALAVSTTESTGFFPTPDAIASVLPEANLLCLNAPQNPTGTNIDPQLLKQLCDQIVAENRRRAGLSKPPVFVLYDQVYWMLSPESSPHAHPVGVCPEIQPYTVYVDAISKCFAAPGFRVGWALGPVEVIERMSALLTHIGAWAPRPMQSATHRFLDDGTAAMDYTRDLRAKLSARTRPITEGIASLRGLGYPVKAVAGHGGLYISMHFDLTGRATKDGALLSTDEDVRRWLLREGGIALVPFTCFGVPENSGWFRASVGCIGIEESLALPGRIRKLIDGLTPTAAPA
jgi:aspartate aminotransferase